MKKNLNILLTIVCVAALLVSCGGNSGLNKDTRADYQMDEKALNAINEKAETGGTKQYEGKIIEMKGIVKSSKKTQLSADPNKYVFYLCSNPAQEDNLCTICYTDEDQAKNTGKAVTVKGKFDYAGTIVLIDCITY